IQGNIADNATVIFSQLSAGSYDGVLRGAGVLTKTGQAALTMTGTSPFTGATQLNQGALYVNGSIAASHVFVHAGTTLGGSGTVGDVTLSGGIIAPGNSIGTLHVSGNLDLNGGTYQAEVDTGGNSDMIAVTGTATLTGGSLLVKPQDGTYGSVDYTILTADGGIDGTFSSVTSALTFLTPTLTYDANDVKLNLTRNNVDLASIASSGNQRSVASVLSALINADPATFKSLTDNLYLLSDADARRALSSLGGVQNTYIQTLASIDHRFHQLLFGRASMMEPTAGLFDLSPSMMLASASMDPATESAMAATSDHKATRRRGAWVQGITNFGSVDATADTSSADLKANSLVLGADTDVQDWVVGVAASLGTGSTSESGASQDFNSYRLAAYAGWQQADRYFNALVDFGTFSTDAQRQIIIGALASVARSHYNITGVSASVEFGHTLPVKLPVKLIPYVGVDIRSDTRGGFTESGAGFANLAAQSDSINSFRTTFGLRTTYHFTSQAGTDMMPYAYLAYVRELDSGVPGMQAAFTIAPTSQFVVHGADIARNRFRLGLGITGQVKPRISINAGYAGEFSSTDNYQSLSATVKWRW
ncbi:MAG TPA: autotransporter domain-containing protein, partial [Pseudomonadales bacterium]|nr:autotransporter domain-containing protein [Pseudomonadales bacterium]